VTNRRLVAMPSRRARKQTTEPEPVAFNTPMPTHRAADQRGKVKLVALRRRT
jgi:hypothetical protein